MSRYPDLVRAIQQRSDLKVAHLVRFDFATGVRLVWDGFGRLATLDPFATTPATAPRIEWDGLGALGSISDIDRSLVSSTTPTLTLSGVDADIALKARNAAGEIRGQPCRIFEQYFDADTSQTVDLPLPLYVGLMDTIQVQVSGPTTRTINLKLVTVLFRRRRPKQAYLSDRTQQSLYPGDLGCSEVPALVQRDQSWP